MNFKRFSAVNMRRCTDPKGFNHKPSDWSVAEWTNAIAGEVGEACNLTKKIIRHRDKVSGNLKPEDQDVSFLKQRAAKELADVMIYADLAIQVLGFDTSEIVASVFLAKSREIGYVTGSEYAYYPDEHGEGHRDNGNGVEVCTHCDMAWELVMSHRRAAAAASGF